MNGCGDVEMMGFGQRQAELRGSGVWVKVLLVSTVEVIEGRPGELGRGQGPGQS